MITKARVSKLIKLVDNKLRTWYHHNFNTVVRSQLNNPKTIPIVIISFNQLNYLKDLVDFLLKKQYTNVVILDNKSTYPPLLDYFDTIKEQVTIYRLQENIGHLSFWKSEAIFKKYSKGYYVVTDADIVPVSECPEDFINQFIKLIDKAFDRTKVGFSLKIDDIPDTNPNKEKIIVWESKFWRSKINKNVYKAPIDTTFALYRPRYSYKLKDFTKAWRTDFPLQASHGGWYLDSKNLTEEQHYYFKTANASASWQINDKGQLLNEVHRSIYDNT
jgi:hypothetical protein